MASGENAEPFPALSPIESAPQPNLENQNVNSEFGTPQRSSTSNSKASTPRRTRTSSILQSIANSNPPLGMWQATGEVGSKIPTLGEIKNGSFSDEGWSHEGQLERRGTNPHEIQKRRRERTTSTSTRTRRSSTTTPSTPIITEERHDFFPRRGSVSIKGSVRDIVYEEAPAHTENSNHYEKSKNLSIAIPENSELADASEQTSLTPNENEKPHQPGGPDETGTYPNGYRFPKKHTWSQSMVIGLKAFWGFFLTPFGFLLTIYMLNVVAWGAMIFFVLLQAAPAMCVPNCWDLQSPRQIWIEIDSQVLNALFCVTGFGLAPWRFRDCYYLFRWRVRKEQTYHRRLAGLYRGWYRLPGSEALPDDIGPPPVKDKKNPQPDAPPPYTPEEYQELEQNPAIPIPPTSMPEAPLTGIRAPPSKSWTIDLLVWLYLVNTLLQCALSGLMWGMNRFNRPSWAVGLLISLGALTGIFAGILVFIEGSRVKKIEGIPVQEHDVVESVEDFQERKAKEDAKQMKKHEKKQKEEETISQAKSVKLKGKNWFTRQ